jgi:hypothetical protein
MGKCFGKNDLELLMHSSKNSLQALTAQMRGGAFARSAHALSCAPVATWTKLVCVTVTRKDAITRLSGQSEGAS